MARWILLFWLLASLGAGAQTLTDTVLVLDPGHGDRAWGDVPADPGACADTPHGPAYECVFSWDTCMRIKRLAEAHGARVFLTLRTPDDDYSAHSWSPDSFPVPGSSQFPFKILTAQPEPESSQEALLARVDSANAIYAKYAGTHRVLFLSVHFDSTSPSLAGVSFYYPTWTEPGPFAAVLAHHLRADGRMRIDLRAGWEHDLVQPHAYAVLSHSQNPDSYLIELGNIRSCNADGGNPDLWRMRDPQVREEYAALLVEALSDAQSIPPPTPPHRIRMRYRIVLLGGTCLGLGLLLEVLFRRRRLTAGG